MDRSRNISKHIRSVCKVCGYQFSLQMREVRTGVIFLILFFYLSGNLAPLKEFADYIEQGISPWLFPIFMNDMVCSLVIFCLWCFLVCNAPFQHPGYLYYAGRAGKRNWLLGEMLFLFGFSGFYLAVVQLFFLILCGTRLTFTMEWGKTLGTLAYTSLPADFYIPFSLPATMMSSLTPLESFVLSFLLSWLAVFWLALCIFFINWVFRTSLGVGVGLLAVFMDITVYNVSDWSWWRFSPVSVAKLSRLSGRYEFLTPGWAILFLTGSSLFMITALCVFAKLRKGIE